MKAKVTMTFSDDAVDAFMEIFGIDDYSKIPEILRAVLNASIKAEDGAEQLDDITVEMEE